MDIQQAIRRLNTLGADAGKLPDLAQQLTALEGARTRAGEDMAKARTPGDSFKASTAANGAQVAITGLEEEAEQEAGRLALDALAKAGAWADERRKQLIQLDGQALGLLRQAVEVMAKRYALSADLRQQVDVLGALCADAHLNVKERMPGLNFLTDAPWPGGSFPWAGPKEFERLFLERFTSINDARGVSTLDDFRERF